MDFELLEDVLDEISTFCWITNVLATWHDRCGRGARLRTEIYDAALRHLEQPKQCYMKAGLADSWNAVVDQVRREHHRKTAFISRFEQIVAGAKRRPERFLVRARKRGNPGRGR